MATYKDPSKKLVQQRVARTRKLMIAGSKLRSYRDRIDDLIKTISSGKEFHADVANEIINIGTNIQSLSTLVRPLSIEGQEKKLQRTMKRKWRILVKKNKGTMSAEKFAMWMTAYSTRNSWRTDGWDGPNNAFFRDYMEPSKTIVEKE